jgi:hypothetical protein
MIMDAAQADDSLPLNSRQNPVSTPLTRHCQCPTIASGINSPQGERGCGSLIIEAGLQKL